MMVTRDQIKAHRVELQEPLDEFYSSLRVSILPDDRIVDQGVREHALKCARLYISQVQFAMNDLLEECLPARHNG